MRAKPSQPKQGGKAEVLWLDRVGDRDEEAAEKEMLVLFWQTS